MTVITSHICENDGTIPPPIPPPVLTLPPLPGKKGLLPLGKKAGAPNKPEKKPSMPMKQLFWDRLILPPKEQRPNPAPNVWDLVQEMDIELPLIEQHFSSAQKKVVEKEIEVSTKKLVSVLDGKRSNAIAIMLSKLPDLNEVIDAIQTLDDEVLSTENLESIIAQLPTTEEVDMVKNAPLAPDSTLDKPERFVQKLSSISKVSDRVKCWHFMKTFEEKKKSVFIPLTKIKSACFQLKNYEPLRIILGCILACGNYLNGGTNRGQADGFNISFLNRIADTKSNVNKQESLLHFIVKTTYGANPGLFSLGVMPELSEAGKIPLSEIEGQLNQLSQQIKENRVLCNTICADPKVGKTFPELIPPFLEDAERTIKHLDILFKETSTFMFETFIFFGIPEAKAKTTTNDAFFGELAKFMEEFSAIWKIVEAEQERELYLQSLEKKKMLEKKASSKPIPELEARSSTPEAERPGSSNGSNGKSNLKKKFSTKKSSMDDLRLSTEMEPNGRKGSR